MSDETGLPRLNPTPQRLDRLALECLDEAASDMASRGLTVTRQIGPDLPELEMDRTLMKEALACLVSHAVQVAAPAARLRVTVKSGPSALMVAIKAPGPGLSDLQREVLFTGEARRATPSRARAIVAAHGGVAWANGREGRGITFYVTLPIRPTGPRNGIVGV